jgi:hypothetical protein
MLSKFHRIKRKLKRCSFALGLAILLVIPASAVVNHGKILRELLAQRNFPAFENYANGMVKDKSGRPALWLANRELIPNYSEAVFSFEELIKDTSTMKTGVLHTNINLLVSGERIIYYAIWQRKDGVLRDTINDIYLCRDTFVDWPQYDSLKIKFKLWMGGEFRHTDLFNYNYVFGKLCGNGMTPPGFNAMEQMVQERDKNGLLAWLRSANTEKQLYAIDGLLQLHNMGMKESEDERRVMLFICNKKGSVRVCQGCVYSTPKITVVANDYKRKLKRL